MGKEFIADKRIAEGYGTYRPHLHKQVLEMALSDQEKTGILRQGLDVGCGAGLSAEALRMYCGHVTGIDASDEMIAAAGYRYREPFYTFLQCRAEEISLPADSFDIVTAAGVTDWVGEMGFMAEKSASFVLRHPFCREALVQFLLLQSNVNAWIVKAGGGAAEAAQDWLRQTLTPVFSRAEEVLLFDGYYRRYRYHEGKRDFGAGQGRPDVGGSSGRVFPETAL